ncbi:MAG TPA: hypothetical protein VFT12_13610 [Thermoanaerobaculia bacterium]|nr:hypothetical protein [Thermoanaerobaculia bacterium]
MKRFLPAAAILLLASSALAQTSDEITFRRTFLLRNVTGTHANPGPTPHHPHLFERGAWTTFYGGAAFLNYSYEVGPEEQRNEIFSTNWFAAGAQRTLGSRGLVLFRGRVSLEPFTIPEDGYPQMLQFISAESGGPLLDSMRAHDLLGEAAVHFAYRVTDASFVHLYAAPVGTPALGTIPYAQRLSSEEFAEAPYAYDVQETFYDSASVITAGYGSRWLSLEASVFGDSVTTGRHSDIPDAEIDSRSARLTIMPVSNLSLQVSRGELGDDERQVDSASITWGGSRGSVSAIYTSRITSRGEELRAGTFETTFRAGASTFMARAEAVDRPSGFLGEPEVDRTAHFAFGYIYDFLRGGYRAGVGVNLDYHTQTHHLEDIYGHKPQAIYVYARLRTEASRR